MFEPVIGNAKKVNEGLITKDDVGIREVMPNALGINTPEFVTAGRLQDAGLKARQLRAQLAASFATCEAIAQQMKAIRAGWVLPERSDLYLEVTTALEPSEESPRPVLTHRVPPRADQ